MSDIIIIIKNTKKYKEMELEKSPCYKGFFQPVYNEVPLYLLLLCVVGAVKRSCCGRAVKTSDFHTGGPRFEPRPGSSALGQGTLSSLPSLSEETLSRWSCV